MRSLVVIGLLLVPSLAFAQAAPGEVDPTPTPVAPAPSCGGLTQHVAAMADRWSVGLSMGGLGIAPNATPDTKTNFGVGEIALRYRLGRHLELEGSVGGGMEQKSDGTQGDTQVSEVVLAARWRFRPERRWNWYVSAGIGAASIASKDATDQERQDATRPVGEVGVGVERRFRHLALQAEFRAIGMGPTKAENDATTMPSANAKSTMPPPASSGSSSTDQGLSGGQVTVGASYYF